MTIARRSVAGILLGCGLLLVGVGCDDAASTGARTGALDASVDAGSDDADSGTSRDSGLVTSADASADDGGHDAGVDAGMHDAGMDAGLPDAGADGSVRDAGQDAGAEGGVDAGVDAGTDGGVDAGLDSGLVASLDGGIDPSGPVAYVRFAHLAFGVGDVHLCVRRTSTASGTEAAHVLLTARDGGTSTDHAWTPLALAYPAITSGDNIVPLGVVDSDGSFTSTAEAWRASDLDTSAAGIGTDAVARCTPRSGLATPIATRVVAMLGAGGLESGGHYTLMATGRATSTPPTMDCLAIDGATQVACPSGALQVLDDAVTPPATGTAVRIVNASTRFAAQGVCHAAVSDLASASTGPSAPVVPTSGAPTLFARVASTPSDDFHSGFVAGPNFALGSIAGSATSHLFGAARRVDATSFTCPSKLYVPPPAGSGIPNTLLGEAYATGAIPQDPAIAVRFDGSAYEAQAVGDTGTRDGDAVTIFVVDVDTTGTGEAAGILPAPILIDE